MPIGRLSAAILTTATVTAAGILTAAPAQAAGAAWNGRYTMVTYASHKAGTSVAARQAEPDFSADYVFASACSARTCTATVVDGPASKNPTAPVQQRYTWDGAQWRFTFDWVWDCFLGNGAPKQWSPSRSWVFYAPQPDGSLVGTWHTDISDGACRGSVIMPVAAYPARG